MLRKKYKYIIFILIPIIIIVGIFIIVGSNFSHGLSGQMIKTFIDLDGDYVIAETVLEEDTVFHVIWGMNYSLEKLDLGSIQIIARDGDGCSTVLFKNTTAGGKIRSASMLGFANLDGCDVTFHKGNASYILQGIKLKGKLKIFFSSWNFM